jgi:hypothetical protein
MPDKTPKALPTPLEDLPPRDPDQYAYFAPAGTRTPFSPRPAAGVAWANAWWLADFSLLVYCDEDRARAGLAGSGFTMQPGHFIADQGKVMIASSPDTIVVAYRGTELPHAAEGGIPGFFGTVLSSAQAWLTNTQVLLTPFDRAHPEWGKVHSGFLDSFSRIEARTRDALKSLNDERPGRAIWYTGHSLGGALATLAAARFGNATGLYTFGCPRVGDHDFVNAFPSVPHHARLTARGDPVPLVPASLLIPYEHIVPETPIEPADGPFTLPDVRRHAPMRYSVKLWNILAERGL